jgi:hypothetical protein
MDADQLLEEWTSGEQSGMRAARVQTLRDDLEEATGHTIPRRIPMIKAHLDNPQWRGTITRKLRDAAEESEGSDSE